MSTRKQLSSSNKSKDSTVKALTDQINALESELDLYKSADRNFNFVQWYRESGIPALQELLNRNVTAAKIYVALIRLADYQNRIVVTNTRIAEIVGLSKSTVCEGLRYLQKISFISASEVSGIKLFTLNPNYTWGGNASHRKKLMGEYNTIILSANIVASPEEMESYRAAIQEMLTFKQDSVRSNVAR